MYKQKKVDAVHGASHPLFYPIILKIFIIHISANSTDIIICTYLICVYIISFLLSSIFLIKVVVNKMYIKNAKFITVIFSFSKRFLICLLCIILAFNIVCKPKNAHAAALGTVATWGLAEYLAALVSSAGLAITINELLEGLGIFENKDKPVSEDQALNWCKNNISVDGDNNVVFTDDAKQFINNYILGTYKDSITMVYRYPLNKANIDPSEFASKVWYDTFCDLLDAFPDYYFYFNNTTWMQGPSSNINDGSKSYSYYCLFVVKDPFAGVNSYPDLMTTPVYLYNQDWSDAKNVSVILVMSMDNFTTRDNIYYLDRSSFNGNHNGSIYSSLDDFKNAGIVFEDASSSALSMCNQFSWKRGVSSFTAYSAKTTPINVYKTVADMKKDIGSQVVGTYTPYYTGQPNYNITTSEVNNIVNNYYNDSGGGSGSGGGSSGSDDSGGGSSILDGLGKVFGAVGKLIDTIFGFILDIFSKLIDNVTKILDMFVGALKKLVDLVPSGFNEFLAALFPYIPEEWKTIIEAMLLVSVLGVVVAVFRR